MKVPSPAVLLIRRQAVLLIRRQAVKFRLLRKQWVCRGSRTGIRSRACEMPARKSATAVAARYLSVSRISLS